MAIENLELNNQNEQSTNLPALIPIQATFKPSQTLIANMQKLRHPLMENVMTLYGFIGEISDKNSYDEFNVHGIKIRFPRSDSKQSQDDYKIYPKILLDLKQHLFYDLFPKLKDIQYSYSDGQAGSKSWGEDDPDNKKNYYFFESSSHETPDVCSNELYLICKYLDDGKFKYALFAPHEVIIEQ